MSRTVGLQRPVHLGQGPNPQPSRRLMATSGSERRHDHLADASTMDDATSDRRPGRCSEPAPSGE